MSMKDQIAARLTAALTPERLEVLDESAQHHGHAGWRDGGETHFRVRAVASAFTGKSRVDRHRLVNAALTAELASTVHALALELKAPGE